MSSKFLVVAGMAVLSVATVASTAQERPKITGISHLAVYTSDAAATDHYYRVIIGAAKQADPENPQGVKYAFSATQFVEVLPLPPNAGINRMDHAAFNTVNAEGMRKYLAAKGWKAPASVTRGSDGSRWFAVQDPEGNKIEFVQPAADAKSPDNPSAIGHHIIHVGLLVHSRAAEDKFYRDLLGFKPYWFGGMQDDKVDWVSQQVPDGHDWVEYMMTSGPSGTGIPANMTQQTLGVLDHFAVGEKSVEDAFKVLQAGNRLEGRHDAAPKIGKDGKGQFNMYDPDGIRAELMNFHATEKPCCSAFTAEDPAE
ncbi:VOC family protein [Telmatobacter sp. DSM 110680]|uniref:VOC family protein n=1 Tax=Telmatobacter sp. DSM 110680 TaxID=3036704 RepID=A0AAU7DRI1_9BACT